jgi:AcrR family transcriptional regulator
MGAKTNHKSRREDILAAAGDLFSRKGFHGTTMPDIAQAAGISAGLIYYFFSSKDDILLACCEKTAQLHLDLFKESANVADPLERFDFIVRKLYQGLDRGSKSIMVTYRDSSTLPREVRHRILEMIKNLDHHFLALFQEGQKAGIFRADIPEIEVLAANVLSLGHLWALQKTWRFLPAIDLETYTSAQLDYFHRQLLPATGESG